jgi:hypothetical protein
MNSISDTSSPGLLQDRSNLLDASFSGQVRESSVNAYQSLDAGLTIQTRDGDIVTLSSSQFSELSAFEYNSQGQIQTDTGKARISQHTREITLTSGEKFSFSVQGDLNDQEFADIESIVQGVDGIIGEMVQGDMEDAVARAMSMGSYDSVSMYSADISVQRSYAFAQETRSASNGPLLNPASNPNISHGPKHVDRLVDKMTGFLKEQEETMLAKAQQPLISLFEQLLKNKSEGNEKENPKEIPEKIPGYMALKTIGKQIDQMINERVKEIFGNFLNGIV